MFENFLSFHYKESALTSVMKQNFKVMHHISLEYINTWTFSFSLILNVSTKIGHACVIKLIYIPSFYHLQMYNIFLII